MIVPRYVPGDWVAVVSDGTVAMVPAHLDGGIVDRLWASLRAGEGLGAHLEVLAEGGLASVPPFALVSLADGAAHAIVRGDLRVLVDAEDGEHELDGAAVTTWHEATVRDARSVHVRAGGAHGGGGDAVSLPVLSAVVRAASVDVELVRETPRGRRAVAPGRPTAPAAAHAATPAPAPVEEPPAPEPAPERAAEPVPAPAPVQRTEEPAPAREQAPTPEQPSVPSPRTSDAPPTEDQAWAPVAPDLPGLPESETPAASPAHAAAEPAAPAAPPTAAPAAAADHDGLTVQSSDVATLRRQLPEWAGDAVPGPFTVPAPQAPPPAKIHLSSGLVISLNRPVLLGRAPQVSRVQNSQIPRLVTVASPNQDISRTHAEVRQEGDHVLVTDLRSTNGVLLHREGVGPQRLHPGDPTIVETGVVVDLGEGVTFVVEHGA